ncbi:class I SAM-dependent methyltransferase [Streptomyces hainanensis]|uniref:Class I SAM-dependent methyltransferase n=1 Tax=Streptomyces hainanensis TaxID=402648 RepID=A0A4R4TT43_9ACTN|nr:class I SAM-dependent methyltransferase [Streptomyces hainanensis]TDC78632.1 class I SAM-dependent methyltransferase [Streptomyces hainanensis]
MRVDVGWDGFWADAPTERDSVFWDAPPEQVVERQLPLFERHLTAGPPLVDAGCGNGTQTRWLAARHRGPVVGVDLSPTAVELARGAGGDAEYEVLDLADGPAVATFRAGRGDCHVYLRGVLHQAAHDDRARIADGVTALLGHGGRAFVVEPARAAKEVLGGLMGRPAGPPPALAAVFAHGISPMEMPDEAVPALFTGRGLTVFASGRLPLATTVRDPDGARVELPSNWLVVGYGG